MFWPERLLCVTSECNSFLSLFLLTRCAIVAFQRRPSGPVITPDFPGQLGLDSMSPPEKRVGSIGLDRYSFDRQDGNTETLTEPAQEGELRQVPYSPREVDTGNTSPPAIIKLCK